MLRPVARQRVRSGQGIQGLSKVQSSKSKVQSSKAIAQRLYAQRLGQPDSMMVAMTGPNMFRLIS